MPPRRPSTSVTLSLPKTSLASSGPIPVPILSRVHPPRPQPPPLPNNSNNQSQSPNNQYPLDDSTLQQTTTTTPNGGTVTLVNTQPGNGSDILISASESANIISIHLINGKTLRIVWENAGPALNPQV